MVRISRQNVIAHRSYPVGEDHFFRGTKNHPLAVTVAFAPPIQPQDVTVVIEYLGTKNAPTRSIPLSQDGQGFTGEISFPQLGTHRFKIQYAHDGQWYWDNRPWAYVVIDPDYLRTIKQYIFIPTASGHMGLWKNDLERIHAMGFNTIHLLPITTMGHSESPYAAKDLFTIDPVYVDPRGAPDAMAQFEDFVAAVKGLHMRLCIDLVFNNVGLLSTIYTNHPEWLCEDPEEVDGIKRGGWSDGKEWHKWNDLVCLNYNNLHHGDREALWKHMTAYALLWSRFAAETGGMIRLDNFHSSDEPFMRHVLGEIRREYPDVMIQAELFDGEEGIAALTRDCGINLLLATPWEHKFVPELRTYLKYVHHKHATLRYFIPICSHDSHSPHEEFGDISSTAPRLAISALLGPGPSGIVQGIEYGLKNKSPFIGKRDREEHSVHQLYFDLIKRFNALIDEFPVFQSAGNLHLIDEGHPAIIAGLRVDPQDKHPVLLVFANLDIHNPQTLHVDLNKHPLISGHTVFFDVLENKPHQREEVFLSVTLPPCGVKVLRGIPA